MKKETIHEEDSRLKSTDQKFEYLELDRACVCSRDIIEAIERNTTISIVVLAPCFFGQFFSPSKSSATTTRNSASNFSSVSNQHHHGLHHRGVPGRCAHAHQLQYGQEEDIDSRKMILLQNILERILSLPKVRYIQVLFKDVPGFIRQVIAARFANAMGNVSTVSMIRISFTGFDLNFFHSQQKVVPLHPSKLISNSSVSNAITMMSSESSTTISSSSSASSTSSASNSIATSNNTLSTVDEYTFESLRRSIISGSEGGGNNSSNNVLQQQYGEQRRRQQQPQGENLTTSYLPNLSRDWIVFAHMEKNKIISLTLASNQMNDSDSLLVASSIRTNMNIIELNLSENHITDIGCTAIADALKYNTTMTRLNLSDNGISNKGCFAIGESLKINATLLEIDISYNKNIGNEGWEFLNDIIVNYNAMIRYVGNDIPECYSKNMNFYLRLNKAGRNNLLINASHNNNYDNKCESRHNYGDGNKHERYFDAILNSRDHVECMFYFLSLYPEICEFEV